MFVSCMQMVSSQCLHAVLDSTRCMKHTHNHTQSQREIYCVISVAEGLRQIKERKKGIGERSFTKKKSPLQT